MLDSYIKLIKTSAIVEDLNGSITVAEVLLTEKELAELSLGGTLQRGCLTLTRVA